MRAPLTVLADLDGTLLPRPTGTGPSVATPPLNEGPAFEPLVRLLSLGAKVIGVTGSGIRTHSQRFFEAVPAEYRQTGRVLLAVETGRRLFRGSPEGAPVEDASFEEYMAARIPPLESSVVERLIDVGRDGIRRFYADLQANPDLVDASGPLAYIRNCSAEEIPVCQDSTICPRIEVRQSNGAVVFVGVPSSVGGNYFAVPPDLARVVEGRPTGRSCFDCVPAGLSKALVVEHLLEAGEVAGGRAVALGDQPRGNDEGLTRWHAGGLVDIPFVSVSEDASMVPPRLVDCHVTARSNAEGSALVLAALAELLIADASSELSTARVAALVRAANKVG